MSAMCDRSPELENFWSTLNNALLQEINQHGSLHLQALMGVLCLYGRDVFTWWNPNLQSMQFTNRGNGKDMWGYLDESLFKGFKFLQELPHVATTSYISERMFEAVYAWERLFQQLQLQQQQYLHANPSYTVVVGDDNLKDLHNWLKILQLVLQFHQQLSASNNNSHDLLRFIDEVMQSWLQIHLNLLRYSSELNNARFTNDPVLLEYLKHLLIHEEGDNTNALRPLVQSLLEWNHNTSNCNNNNNNCMIITDEDQNDNGVISLNSCSLNSINDHNNNDNNNNNNNNNSGEQMEDEEDWCNRLSDSEPIIDLVDGNLSDIPDLEPIHNHHQTIVDEDEPLLF